MYGKKKMMGGGMVSKMADGGLTEQKAKRPNPYTGNEPEMKEMESETSSQKFADGGMAGKKGAVMAIVAKLAKKPMATSKEMSGEETEENDRMEEEEGMEASKEAKMAAAEEVMGALKSGDKEAFAGALENFMRACEYSE
jgi:hypothetical protein